MAPSLETIAAPIDSSISIKKSPAVEITTSSEVNGQNGEVSVKPTENAQLPSRTFELEDHPIDAPSKIRVCAPIPRKSQR